MKKTNTFHLMIALGLFFLTSCTTSAYLITDNPVGTKMGIARMGLFGKNKDVSIEAAAKNGKITKIGTVEMKTTFFIFPFTKTIVTGE